MTNQAQAPPVKLETDSLYGCLCLSSTRTGRSLIEFPFSALKKVMVGNHLHPYLPSAEKEFDYILGGGMSDREPEYAKLSNTSRGITISGMKVGDVSEENQVKHLIYNLLTLNTNNTEDEKDTPYLDLVYSKITKNLTGRFLSVFDITSARSKFVIVSRSIPVYMFVACDDSAVYMFWSNEETLRHRMREAYGNKFFYYSLTPMVNGTLVIQSLYLSRLMYKWWNSLHSDLKVLNVFDEYLIKKTIVS